MASKPKKSRCVCCKGKGVIRYEAGPQMRTCRLAANLKLVTVAEAMGVSQGMLCMMEKGKRKISAPMLNKFYEAVRTLNEDRENPYPFVEKPGAA